MTNDKRAWLMIVLAALAMVATLPGRTHGLGMITERLLADPRLGIDRNMFGHLNFWATLIGALFCLGCGSLIDRFGSRRVMTGVVLLLGASVLVMCRVSGWLPFFILLTLTRGLGQSALSVVSLTLVGKWFCRRLSVAMGIYSVLVAVGFMAAFGVYRGLHELPWTAVWASLGWLLLLIVAPLSWLLVRDGTLQSPPDARAVDAPPERPVDYSLFTALATPAFWTFGLATSIYGLIAAGTSLFNESLLRERSFPANAFYEVAMIGAFVGMAFNFLGGWLARGSWLRGVTAAALAVLAGSLVALPQITDRWQLIVYAVGMGASGGVMTVVFFTVWGRLYGPSHLGRIQGVAQMLTVLASAAGPQLMAQWHTRSGSYAGLLYWLAGAVVLLSVAALLTPLPQPLPQAASDSEPRFASEAAEPAIAGE